jgi:LmbE family N-acetylglucosaminyl deacetylase
MKNEHTPAPVPASAMVIFAHPDDAEFVSAGTVAYWAENGCEVTYLLGTSGDKGTSDPDIPSADLIAMREREQAAAAEILGVKHVEFLRYPDATLVADLDLRRAITRMIRKHKPEAVICQDPTARYVGQEYIQHPDHIAMGEASLAAIFPSARDHLTFPELLEEGFEPHKVKYVYLSGAHEADVWIDIGAVFEKKIEALKAHGSQVSDWDPDPMLRKWAQDTAAEARFKRYPGSSDMGLAESFKFFDLG